MAYTTPAIPGIPPNIDPALRNVLNAIKEALEVRTRQRGAALDASPTFRDLLDAGLISLRDGVSISGKNYSMDQLLGMVNTGLPSWITSDTAPPAPIGLVVNPNIANISIGWTATTFELYAYTEVWRATVNNLSAAVLIGSSAGVSYTDALPAAGTAYYYWVRDVSLNGLTSPYNATGGTSNSTAPSATTLTAALSNTDGTLTLTWPTPVSNLAIQYYVIQYGGSAWDTGTTQLTVINANSYKVAAWWLGALTFRIKAVDINGNYGPEATAAATVTAPGAPVSFTSSIIGNKVQLDWSSVSSGSLPTRRYEVHYGASYTTGSTFVAQVDGTTLRTVVDWIGPRTYWVAAIDYAGNTGTPKQTVPVVTINAPSTPVPTATFSGATAVVSWPTPAASLPISYYTVTQGASRNTVATLYGNQASDVVTWSGAASRTYYVTAYDINNNPSAEGSVTLISTPLGAPSATLTIAANDSSYRLSWSPPSIGSLPVAFYEVFDGATSLGKTTSLFFSAKVYWSGGKTLSVVATDAGGVVGAIGSASVNVTAPAAPTVTAQVVDNNVLLYWNQPSSTLPIITFEIRRGATWAGATVIGSKSGGFTTIFETSSGNYTYWVAAIDSSNNYGTPASASAIVSQPPDYVLKANWYSSYTVSAPVIANTFSNAVMYDATRVMLPINASATFGTHFTGNAWTTIQNQIDAGYPVYIQPAQSPGYYEEIIDYGTVLAATRVSVSWLLTTVAGSVSATCDISVSADNVLYTTYTNTQQTYVTNTRYIKVRVNVTAATGAGIGHLSNLNIRLDSKLKTITGMVSCLSTDTGGTVVYLTDDRLVTGVKQFVDVDAIQLTPQYNATYPGSVALYDFTDTPNPLSFKALMYDNAGTRISGTASYTVRGF